MSHFGPGDNLCAIWYHCTIGQIWYRITRIIIIDVSSFGTPCLLIITEVTYHCMTVKAEIWVPFRPELHLLTGLTWCWSQHRICGELHHGISQSLLSGLYTSIARTFGSGYYLDIRNCLHCWKLTDSVCLFLSIPYSGVSRYPIALPSNSSCHVLYLCYFNGKNWTFAILMAGIKLLSYFPW